METKDLATKAYDLQQNLVKVILDLRKQLSFIDEGYVYKPNITLDNVRKVSLKLLKNDDNIKICLFYTRESFGIRDIPKVFVADTILTKENYKDYLNEDW